MAAHGGNRWSRAITLSLVLASCGIALSACEYEDDSPAHSDASAAGSPSSPPPVPMASPAPIDTPAAFSPPVAKDDPALARVRVRNQAQLESRLGLPPDGLVSGGSGGLGDGGLRTSATEIPKGSYIALNAWECSKHHSPSRSETCQEERRMKWPSTAELRRA
jgi:hypothetical protein